MLGHLDEDIQCLVISIKVAKLLDIRRDTIL